MAQDDGHILVEDVESIATVDQEDDDIGLVDGQVHLLADFFFKNVVRPHHIAAGVDDGEFLSIPIALAVVPVACHAARLFHDGHALLQQTVEQSRFSHIGSPHNSYNV